MRVVQDLASRIAGFADYLRLHDISADSSSIIDAHRIAHLGYVQNRLLLKAGYRSCFCRNRDHWARFDAVFDAYWQSGTGTDAVEWSELTVPAIKPTAGDQRLVGFAGISSQLQDKCVTGAGDFKALSLADFRFVFDKVQMRQIEDLIEQLAKRARRQFYRRDRKSAKPGRIDLGRSVERAIRTRGQLINLRYHQQRRRLPRIVLILDVSQSMDVYAKLFLRFTRQLMSLFDQTEAFAFNTELIPLGSGFQQLTEQHFEMRLNQFGKGWLGGTKIAESLQIFNQRYLHQLVDHRTTVVIFSDGCDTATPAQLAAEVTTVQQRAKKLVWVNPLLGRYAVGESDPYMDPVRPFVDVYHSAHNLQSLKSLQFDLLG